jgi:hypothetical protein
LKLRSSRPSILDTIPFTFSNFVFSVVLIFNSKILFWAVDDFMLAFFIEFLTNYDKSLGGVAFTVVLP